MPPPSRAPQARTVDVTAVLVACDGARWLPTALAALAASTAVPAYTVCVDNASTDGSAALMAAAYGQVLALPHGTGFGAAVAAALRDRPVTGWIWLLHDDCAPEPEALGALLEQARAAPTVALLGPKARDWADPRVLVEVGLSTDAAGHRETGLDRREYDQGQHDAIRAVLAVGTAGALIRRDVWDAVGGLDPQLPVFRDDLDLGWRVNAAGHGVLVVPTARIRHARAATTGQRALPAASGRPAGTDRRNALFVLLAHAAGPRLLLALPRLILGSLLRAVGLLLLRQPAAAGDELGALAAVLGRPARLRAARRARAQTRTVPPRHLRPLLARRSGRLRGRVEALAGWLSAGAAPGTGSWRPLRRPGVLTALALALVALLAERNLLAVRGGALFGGRLLPVPPGARDLWASYLGGWHPVTVGSSVDAHPYVGLLAAGSTLLFGKPWLVVDGLLLAAVPISGAVAYAAAGTLTRRWSLRAWAAASWALLPVATGAVAAGRLDAAVTQIALPGLLVGAAAVLRGDPRTVGWRRAWALGLALALTAAFAPVLWPLLAGLLVVGAAVLRSGRRLMAAGVVALVPAAVLMPWSLSLLAQPGALVRGPGAALPVAQLPAWQLALLQPGGPGSPSWWITAGLVLAALGALLRRDVLRWVGAAWLVVLGALGLAVAVRQQALWPGGPVALAGAGLLTAAVLGAEGARARLARTDFGWRQLMATVVAVAAAAGPLVAAVSWVARGADDPLRRGGAPVLPAFAAAELRSVPGLRALVVRPGRPVGYELIQAGGDSLGAADTPPAAGQLRALDAVVADLLAVRGSDAAAALATRAVRYVALPAGPGSAALATALDSQQGLARRASGDLLLWRVVAPASRLTVLAPAAAAAALRGDRAPSQERLRSDPPTPLPAGPEAAATVLRPGPPGRVLVLAAAADPGWRASLDGHELARRTAWGWAQGFLLPPGGGRLALRYDQSGRHRALAGQALALAAVLVLAAPAARRRRGLEPVEDDDGGAE